MARLNEWSDAQIDAHYARNYYGPGTDYFDPPEYDEDDDEYEDEPDYPKESERWADEW